MGVFAFFAGVELAIAHKVGRVTVTLRDYRWWPGLLFSVIPALNGQCPIKLDDWARFLNSHEDDIQE